MFTTDSAATRPEGDIDEALIEEVQEVQLQEEETEADHPAVLGAFIAPQKAYYDREQLIKPLESNVQTPEIEVVVEEALSAAEDEALALLSGADVSSTERRRDLLMLYTAHLLNAFGDRLWKFVPAVCLAIAYPKSLAAVAIFSAVSFLAGFFFSPVVGRLVDRAGRLTTVMVSLFFQNLCTALSALAILMVLVLAGNFDTTSAAVVLGFASFFAAVSALGTTALNVSLQKDWIVVISHHFGSVSAPLARMNATMTMLDQMCDILAPLFFGVFLTLAGPKLGLLFTAAWHIFSFFPCYFLLLAVHESIPALQTKRLDELAAKPRRQTHLMTLYHGWRTYIHQPILLSSISAVLLYMTVLSHGTIMISFLKGQAVDMPDMSLGSFRAAAACLGLIASICSPFLIRFIGIRRGSMLGLWSQQLCLLISVALFVFAWIARIKGYYGHIYAFLTLIVLSRGGLWVFKLSHRQIMQEQVKTNERGIVNASEEALMRLAEFSMLILTLIFNDVNQFIVLVLMSLFMVSLAALLNTLWALQSSAKEATAAASGVTADAASIIVQSRA